MAWTKPEVVCLDVQ